MPVPVTLNRFLALEFVLTFGIGDAFLLDSLLADHTGDHLWSHLGLQSYEKSRNIAAFSQIWPKIYAVLSFSFFFCGLGAQMASIRLPSILGMPSSTPESLSRSANFSSSNSPRSLNWIARPLN